MPATGTEGFCELCMQDRKSVIHREPFGEDYAEVSYSEAETYNYWYLLIYKQFMGGVAPRKIAKEFNISRQRVHDIVKIYRRQAYKWHT